MKITPLDINNQKFRTKFRGFDVREVDEFLQAVAGELELQLKENLRLKERVTELESRVERLKDITPAPKGDESPDRAETMKTSMLQEAEAAMEGVLDGMKVEADKLKEEIKHLKKTKEQLDTYFESFLRFNIELLDTWNKRES
ncbi:MAG: DivIVA domain-containing protein [Deltaproteobacteria bacterium]|nr:DivIVA domain-containing protein [Deltaproteobacteria bacterium]MBW2650159.1 DivIVA domain-containing protein [Deltaproteobacteria bacterium]